MLQGPSIMWYTLLFQCKMKLAKYLPKYSFAIQSKPVLKDNMFGFSDRWLLIAARK